MTHLKQKILVTSVISLVLTVACSLNVHAYDIVTPVKPTGNRWEWGNTNWTWTRQDTGATSSVQGSSVYLPNPGSEIVTAFTRVLSTNTVDLVRGKYYGFTVSFTAEGYKTGDYMALPGFNRLVSTNYWHLVSIKENTGGCRWEKQYEIPGSTMGTYWMTKGCEFGTVSYEIVMQADTTRSQTVQIGNSNQYIFMWKMTGSGNQNGTATAGVITEYDTLEQGEALQAQQNEINAGEQSQQDAEAQGASGQQDAEQGSASLLQGAGHIIGALTNTSASDCTINMNLGHLNLGTQNFCQGNIEQIRPILATVTNILFAFISLRIFAFLIGVMFGLFDQFFGTKTERGGGV